MVESKLEPVDPLLSLGRVTTLTTLSRATIYRKMEDGTFPRALKIGKSRVAWRQSDVAQWQCEQFET
jgi:prophage regulatory protein